MDIGLETEVRGIYAFPHLHTEIRAAGEQIAGSAPLTSYMFTELLDDIPLSSKMIYAYGNNDAKVIAEAKRKSQDSVLNIHRNQYYESTLGITGDWFDKITPNPDEAK